MSGLQPLRQQFSRMIYPVDRRKPRCPDAEIKEANQSVDPCRVEAVDRRLYVSGVAQLISTKR